jgi:hypothetical protein
MSEILSTPTPSSVRKRKHSTAGPEGRKTKKTRPQEDALPAILTWKGELFDDDTDKKLAISDSIIDIWVSALTREDRLVHYIGYGETVRSKGKIPVPKQIAPVGLTWFGNHSFIGNPIGDNEVVIGSQSVDAHDNTVCITSARGMGFWPFPPSHEPEVIFLVKEVEEDLDKAALETIMNDLKGLVFAVVATPKAMIGENGQQSRPPKVIVKAIFRENESRDIGDLSSGEQGWEVLPNCTGCGQSCPWNQYHHTIEECRRVDEYNTSRGGKAGWVERLPGGNWRRRATTAPDTLVSIGPRVRRLEKLVEELTAQVKVLTEKASEKVTVATSSTKIPESSSKVMAKTKKAVEKKIPGMSNEH